MRIVTRPDFDGVVCAVLLYEVLDICEPVKWVEPDDLQKGRIEIRSGDIIANLPYNEKCALWFDHHYTNRIDKAFEGAFKIAPSAASIIYDYYSDRLKRDFRELVEAANKIDSADLTLSEVQHPQKHAYIMLSMTVFNGENLDEPYWNKLVALLRKYDIQRILDDPQVKQRCSDILQQNQAYVSFLKENTKLNKHVSITDFRAFIKPPAGNRFLVYTLFPESYANIRIRYEDKNRDKVTVHVGHSIFNPKCNVNVGLMLADFDGGGHRGAGSGRFPAEDADANIAKIINTLLENKNNEK